ncbi:MAG TPA: hypothetical protein VGL81_36275 [Polyangiaceae bacterium]|jgi:hypothetical protein
MRAISLAATRADEALRVVKALGSHRYVAGRLHLVHALAFGSVRGEVPGLAEAQAWAKATLARDDVDPSSRDEALWRRATDAELVAVLDAFWTPGETASDARHGLRNLLQRYDLRLSEHAPFDESAEDEMHPLLIDAGWELLPLAALDPQRHRGAMDAFGDALAFESARFEEETAIPPPTYLYELPALSPVELLLGASGDDGALAGAPLVVWADGHETYLDYVLRGVRRAAKLPERDDADEAAD